LGANASEPASSCQLLWQQGGLAYDWTGDNERGLWMNVTLPAAVALHNASLYAHVFVYAEGTSPDPSARAHAPGARAVVHHPVVIHARKPKRKVVRSLLGDAQGDAAGTGTEAAATPTPGARSLLSDPLGWSAPVAADATPSPEPAAAAYAYTGDEETGPVVDGAAGDAAEAPPAPVVALWKPTLAVQVVHDFSGVQVGSLPPFLSDFLAVPPLTADLEAALRSAGAKGSVTAPYTPITFVNDFWLLREHLLELNGSATTVPLELSFSLQSLWKWQVQQQMASSWETQRQWGAVEEGETDEMKRMVLETNPWLLGVTVVVTLLHTIFDFLAFRNDVAFWRSTKTMEGLSLRTVSMNVFFQVVIFLYLLDNDTSWMVLISSGIGLAIEAWKLRRVAAVNVTWPRGAWRPQVLWEDKDAGYVQSRTKEYDDMAFRHLSLVLYPLVLGYATYSLVHSQHKSWYSWVISSLTGFVYAFGFILMTPQLFINYKLKSVAHLPWRAMVYKSLNTFIDDFFAFIVKMPTLHRIAVFRDDLVFLVFLYQRWIYPVDRARANEFGVRGVDYDAAASGDLRAAVPPSARAKTDRWRDRATWARAAEPVPSTNTNGPAAAARGSA
jgi:hypothetical protein